MGALSTLVAAHGPGTRPVDVLDDEVNVSARQ
jgi:hypothetical protein